MAGLSFCSALFAQETEQIVDSLTNTIIHFEEETFDFGCRTNGAVITHVYRFKNIGNVPLVISDAKGSCGCTVPYFPKQPVYPGEESEIEVTFDSKDKPGPQSKRVTITANTVPSQTFLTIKGMVYDRPCEYNASLDQQEATNHESSLQKIEEAHPNCFALFPNPTYDQLQLELKEYIGQSAEVMISNSQGQPVHQSRIDRISRDATRFDVSTYPSGIYMVTIRIPDKPPMTQCFVIVR